MANVDQVAGANQRQTREAVAWRPATRVLRRVLTSDKPRLWLLPVVLLLLFIGVYPLVYNIANSFREFIAGLKPVKLPCVR